MSVDKQINHKHVEATARLISQFGYDVKGAKVSKFIRISERIHELIQNEGFLASED